MAENDYKPKLMSLTDLINDPSTFDGLRVNVYGGRIKSVNKDINGISATYFTEDKKNFIFVETPKNCTNRSDVYNFLNSLVGEQLTSGKRVLTRDFSNIKIGDSFYVPDNADLINDVIDTDCYLVAFFVKDKTDGLFYYPSLGKFYYGLFSDKLKVEGGPFTSYLSGVYHSHPDRAGGFIKLHSIVHGDVKLVVQKKEE